ncbi:MAG: putative porin, partial [Bacteroidales bacterium]
DTTGFYPIMHDTVSVKDSTAVMHFTNKAGARFHMNTLDFDLSVQHRYCEFWQENTLKSFNELLPALAGELKKDDWVLGAQTDFTFCDDGFEGWSLQANYQKSFPALELDFKTAYHTNEPPKMLNSYRSSYYAWENNFDNTSLWYGSAELNHKYGKVSASFTDIANYVYFDREGFPAQHQKSFQFARVKLEPKVQWYDFTFNNTLLYQRVIGKDLLRLPEFMSRHSLFYSFYLIRGELQTQVGARMTYHSSFYGHQYYPATQAFALQNEQKVGNYPYLDVFANFYIKRTRFFFRYSHVNALLNDNAYFLMPSYPMQDNTFQFGVSWMFYD